ncbi:MAG: tetratricopeptide repeat protein [Pseudonocardiaceae bacterium]
MMTPSEPARTVAEVALARGEGHRVDGQLEAAELAYFEAACEAGSASEGAEAARHVVMRARIGLGRIELIRGSPDRALGWFLNACDAAPDEWEPLYWQGCSQGRLADYRGADRSLTAALRLNPRESSIAIQRSYARFKIGDLAAALEDLLAAEEQGGLDDAALLVLVSLRLEQGEWMEGERILRTLLDRNPSSVRACELMGVTLELQAKPEEALGWYMRAAALGDVSPLTCGRVGILHTHFGHPEVATKWLRRARLARHPDDGVLYHSGWASFQLGDFQESIDNWGKLQSRHSGRQLEHLLGTAKHELARERIAVGNYDAALSLLEDCISCDIGGFATIRVLAEVRLRIAARVLADRGREGHDAAKDHLRAAAALVSDDYRFPFFLALMEWADGDPSTALPLLKRACDHEGVSRPARLTVVRCALEAGDAITAEGELLRVADRPGQHVRRLARCLGAGRWSEAADLLLAGEEPDLAAALMGHCLIHAGRCTEVDLSSRPGARAGLLHGLASAARGELDEARSILAAVTTARPDLPAASAGLAHVERLLAIRAVEAGSWQDAAGMLAGSSPADGRLAPAPLLEGLILLVAGRRRQAGSYLEEVLRRNPADNRVLHAVTALWLNGGQESVSVPAGIAALAAVMNDEVFWERFRSSAASRYRAAIPPAALADCRRHTERHAYAQAGPSYELLLLREMAAAGLLGELGGFPSADDGLLVCGPFMISLLGLQGAWGEFVAREPAPDDSRSDRWRQLRQLFSGLGVATALLAAERPEEALAALDAVACERCRLATAPEGYPKVCAAACPDFDARHPSYAHLLGKGQRLAEDAARLSITAQLAVARRVVASDPDDVGTTVRLWADAIRAAAIVGAQEQTQRHIADTALGRVKSLDKAERLGAAIKLVEAAQQVLPDSPAREELHSELGQLLCDRGVAAANDGRLEPALSDLRRAARFSPHSARPLVNLSLALQRLADQRRDLGDRVGEYESLREAKRMLEGAAAELSGSPEFEQQLVSVRKELRTVCNRWALGLAAAARYREALEVLDQGLVELPDDVELRHSRQTVQRYATPLRDRGRAGS